MESDFTQGAGRSAGDAHRALGDIDADRARIGERMTAETWWGAPAQGFGAALLVAAPAAGLQWAWLLFVASTWVFVGVEMFFRKRSGLSINRPAGPRGWVLVIALIVLLLAALAAAVVLAAFDLRAGVLLVAAATGLLFTGGVVLYDRVYAAEVRRAR